MSLLLKGVLHPDNAARAVAIGCDGRIVFNNGGQFVDGAPASFEVLPAIARCVAVRVPVLFDSGIRRGADVFSAIAAGAKAVLIGRTCVWGLAAAGADGVAKVSRVLRDELEVTMALAGCACLADTGGP